MNVLELLSKELEGKNWTTEEKCRYLYIRSCELFSYDERYDFSNLEACERFCFSRISNRKINLEDVTDNRVICKTHAKEVVSTLIEEILGIQCKNEGCSHVWSIFDDEKRMIYADATVFSDLARTKMGLTTKGYNPVIKYDSFTEELKQIDKKIGYIQDEYENSFLEGEIKKLLQEYSKSDYFKMSHEILIDKLLIVKKLFERYKLPSFSDSEFCISYLTKKVLKENIKEKISLFKFKNTEDWDFVNIYPFQLENDTIYFILQKIESGFCFEEITDSDAKNYVKSLPGKNRDIILNQEKYY